MNRNLSNCEKARKKGFRGFNGIRTRGLCVNAAVLSQLSYEDPYTGDRPIYWVHQPVKGMKHRMKWCELREYKWNEYVTENVPKRVILSRIYKQVRRWKSNCRHGETKFASSELGFYRWKYVCFFLFKSLSQLNGNFQKNMGLYFPLLGSRDEIATNLFLKSHSFSAFRTTTTVQSTKLKHLTNSNFIGK